MAWRFCGTHVRCQYPGILAAPPARSYVLAVDPDPTVLFSPPWLLHIVCCRLVSEETPSRNGHGGLGNSQNVVEKRSCSINCINNRGDICHGSIHGKLEIKIYFNLNII